MIFRPEFLREKFEADPEEAPHFRILILYTAREPAIRAMKVMSKIEERLKGRVVVDYEIWRVDALELPEAQGQIRWAGTIADLIVIASESPEISERVSDWLRHCITAKHSNAAALVRLFDGPAVAADELSEEMNPIAAGLDFYMHEIRGNEAGLRKVLRANYPEGDGCQWRTE